MKEITTHRRSRKDHFKWLVSDEQAEKRFWVKVKKGRRDECWPWLAWINNKGYGCFRFRGKDRPASRVAYIFTFGDIPDHLEACHTCDNPICANPHHIFLGTHKENLHDAIKKGRKAILRGEQIATKLTSDKVIQIRKLFFNGECTLQEIADRYGICKGYTWNVVHGLFWKHIT